MQKKTYNWTNIALNINNWLHDYSLYNKRYSRAVLIGKLTVLGFPKASKFIAALVKNGFLKEEKFGKAMNYYFTEPILQGKFYNVMTSELDKMREYSKNWQRNNMKKNEPKSEKTQIAEAIQLLKDTGNYQIFEKVVEWKEI